MREILFRGKRIDSGEWVYGGYRVEKIGEYPIAVFIIEHLTSGVFENHRVDPETVGQYTGLNDKNGKKIFEGDIVNITYNTTVENAVIEYKGASFYGSTFADCWELDNYYEIEVIGNIHDNPELLKAVAKNEQRIYGR